MKEQTYTIQEAAELLEFTDQTIREWVRRGHIRAVKPGLRAYRIPRSEVDRLLAQRDLPQEVSANAA